MSLKYETVLLKISGEALKGDSEIYDEAALEGVGKQIVSLAKEGLRIGIVVGGGNIWRGKMGQAMKMPQIDADYMGMLATMMNALALETTISRLGYTKVVVYSALETRNISDPYSYREARAKLSAGYIVIFAAGTGYSYFTTDTGAAIRAIEIGADALMMAKNGVAGVYDSDPKLNPNAKIYKKLTHKDITDRDLRVMDLTAATLARDGKLKIEVFDMQGPNNIVKVMHNELPSTIIE
ncbi:uridylate kinase [Entomoplasma freundtii]|uniref:Uridylate kinase n=1 Tax=Entomoplasma freundtii TaxID=74700 RepID=A0A2K8NS15_9MOLU|nr:UMP kinase [Entomoplasma freundtii]ATZ16544.1 uridylate kinase [Entomoplasma freundtii]TDY58290.1 uridylate kinase [Entomoplasma freundtii]